jgi:DNA-directed RNA polymerase specialized sigma24 family protein
MHAIESVSQWIDRLREGDSQAAAHLWERYFARLVNLARQKLRKAPRRSFDEEDVVLDVMDSVCRGIEQGRYPRLDNRDDLWRLLFTITLRKSVSRIRHHQRQRRGGGRVRGESQFGVAADDSAVAGIANLPASEPDPETVVEFAEQTERLLAMLGDETLRQIAQLKLEGHTDDEIAARVGCVRRTVVRKLSVIRGIWSTSIDDDA